ncbi:MULTISPECIES: hypothetical protein [unclassified Janthinobacterium]|uniref:hypothetical protein n=1 Tax=unclassified Janthinobacterium TaxID=2610881 RepID=UPI0016079D1B|nr:MULTISPECIES: hypothetical protein [unclassified Janthinobacterium]MBB5606070.1 hypothetical protein [Janthinobacterium sp. S3T4]MBB5616029.1 hypothetical protein [Janthinobacterium sp. S3M3]
MDKQTFIIAGVIFIATYLLATAIYFLFKRYITAKEATLLQERVRLDDFRAHLERQLMELNLKFSVSEGKWKELNHLVLAGQTPKVLPNMHGVTSTFLSQHGINRSEIKVDKNLLFVITPFHEDLSDEFAAVKEAGESLDFNVNRGDERVEADSIFLQILNLILSSNIIVANITGRNPNVFYELGLAHAFDKKVILISHHSSPIPFDVQAKRILFYKDNEELKAKLTPMLKEYSKN